MYVWKYCHALSPGSGALQYAQQYVGYLYFSQVMWWVTALSDISASRLAHSKQLKLKLPTRKHAAQFCCVPYFYTILGKKTLYLPCCDLLNLWQLQTLLLPKMDVKITYKMFGIRNFGAIINSNKANPSFLPNSKSLYHFWFYSGLFTNYGEIMWKKLRCY